MPEKTTKTEVLKNPEGLTTSVQQPQKQSKTKAWSIRPDSSWVTDHPPRHPRPGRHHRSVISGGSDDGAAPIAPAHPLPFSPHDAAVPDAAPLLPFLSVLLSPARFAQRAPANAATCVMSAYVLWSCIPVWLDHSSMRYEVENSKGQVGEKMVRVSWEKWQAKSQLKAQRASTA